MKCKEGECSCKIDFIDLPEWTPTLYMGWKGRKLMQLWRNSKTSKEEWREVPVLEEVE